MLDWIFEGIVGWVGSIVSQLMDAVSGLFLEALGTDMTAMEEYFPFVTKAYDVMQITAWAILILITVWQLFRAFGGPITEAENPWHLLVRGAMFALLIGYAKPIFSTCLAIARAPYTALMDINMTASDFTFAGIEQALTNGLTSIIAVASAVGLILILILEIALGWNYFKLLLETVERYIVVGVLCYTSPLAFSMGASKATNQVFKSWCRMVGSQLLLLVMNVWFLRGFASSMGQYIANGGALTTGKGSIFLWLFCAIAYLKCAQKFDSYLGAIGLNVAQTGSGMGMELLMAARLVTGVGGGAARSAGSMFGRAGGSVATGTGAAAAGFAQGFASRFSPNTYVRDAVVQGGQRMGFSGGAGFMARAFGGIAARNGATLNSNSISSVATRAPNASGTIAGDIADRSLGNYMPQMQGFQLQGTQITGGHISTTAISPEGKQSAVDMYSAAQFEKPDAPHSVVTASDGSQWYSASLQQQNTTTSDMLSKLGGVTGQMFPVTSEEKELERTVPVSYSTYKAKTVTVVTAVQVNGIVMTKRVKEDKSLVDIEMTALTCREHYRENVDSFLLVSSDSDYWGLISSLPDARFLLMIEKEKCGPEMKATLVKHGIFYCYIDSFYDGNCEEIKKKALFNEMYRMLNNSLKLNAHEMFKEALYATRIQMKAAEQKRFFEKHISKMRLVIDEKGDVSIKLAT